MIFSIHVSIECQNLCFIAGEIPSEWYNNGFTHEQIIRSLRLETSHILIHYSFFQTQHHIGCDVWSHSLYWLFYPAMIFHHDSVGTKAAGCHPYPFIYIPCHILYDRLYKNSLWLCWSTTVSILSRCLVPILMQTLVMTDHDTRVIHLSPS